MPEKKCRHIDMHGVPCEVCGFDPSAEWRRSLFGDAPSGPDPRDAALAEANDEIARLRIIVDERYAAGRATFLIDWLDPRRLVITGPTGREEDAIKAAVGLIQVTESIAKDLYERAEYGT